MIVLRDYVVKEILESLFNQFKYVLIYNTPSEILSVNLARSRDLLKYDNVIRIFFLLSSAYRVRSRV